MAYSGPAFLRSLPTGSQLRIREAEAVDAGAVLDYLHRVSAESPFLSFGVGEFDKDLEQERAYLADSRSSENSLFLIAEVDGRIVAGADCHGGKKPRLRHFGEIGISVAQASWGMGIASDLMRQIIGWAEGAGLRKLNLHVRTDNTRALALYEKLGFRHEGRVTRGIRNEGSFHDVLIMGLQIDPGPRGDAMNDRP